VTSETGSPALSSARATDTAPWTASTAATAAGASVCAVRRADASTDFAVRSASCTARCTSRTYPTTPICISASRRRMAFEPQKKAAFQPSLPCWIGP
jgi:hypothetical protein